MQRMNLYNDFLDEWSEKWFEFIKNNPDKNWKYKCLSLNPNITWKIVQENPDKPWDYYELSRNPNITWEIVQANPDKDWDYLALCQNPNIKWEIVQANPDKPWNYCMLSSNPNITWEIIQANRNKPWDFQLLSWNKMTPAREEFIRKKFQGWFRRSNLKAELMANVWHPRNFEKFRYLDPETFGEEF